MSPCRHLTAHAARTPSVEPPEPISTSLPVTCCIAAVMAPATSPPEISEIRAPTSRTCSMIGRLRSRSRMITVRSRGWWPSALAIRRRFHSTGMSMSITPRARRPTTSFSM